MEKAQSPCWISCGTCLKSWHLKRRYVHITNKMLQVEYGLKAPSMLRYQKHARIETAAPEEGSIAPLARSSSTSFWITGWWAAAALTLKCQKSWNKGGRDLSWRWWPQIIFSTNLLHVMLLHWSKIWTAYQPEMLQMMRRMKRLRALAHQDTPLFFLTVKLVETLPPVDFLLLGWTSLPLSKWGLLGKDARLVPSTDPERGLFCTVKWNPVCAGLASPLRRKRLRQPHRMSLCQRPINMAIQTSLTRRSHLL